MKKILLVLFSIMLLSFGISNAFVFNFTSKTTQNKNLDNISVQVNWKNYDISKDNTNPKCYSIKISNWRLVCVTTIDAVKNTYVDWLTKDIDPTTFINNSVINYSITVNSETVNKTINKKLLSYYSDFTKQIWWINVKDLLNNTDFSQILTDITSKFDNLDKNYVKKDELSNIYLDDNYDKCDPNTDSTCKPKNIQFLKKDKTTNKINLWLLINYLHK